MPAYIEQSASHSEVRRLFPQVPELAHAGKCVIYHASSYPLPPHSHRFLEIHYIQRGKIHWNLAGKTWEVPGGQVFIARPGEKHGGLNNLAEPCQALWLGLNLGGSRWLGLSGKETAVLVKALLGLPRVFPVPPRIRENFRQILGVLKSRREPFSTLRLKAAILNLIVIVIQYGASRARDGHSVMVREAIRIMNDRLEQPLALPELSRLLGWSASHLKTQFRLETGIPPANYFLRRRIQEAASRLANTSLSVTTIAMDMGFPSSQAFANTFKRITGLTPQGYRGQNTAPGSPSK